MKVNSLDDVETQVWEILKDKNSVAATFAGLLRNVINQCELVRNAPGVSDQGAIHIYLFASNMMQQFSIALRQTASGMQGADEFFKEFDKQVANTDDDA